MAGFGEEKSSKKNKNNNKPERKIQMGGDTLFRSAINHHKRGDLVNAEKDYREAIKTGYSQHRVFSNLGVICKNSGRSEEAILLYKKAIEISPNQPAAYNNLGNLHFTLGNFEDAAAFSSKSLELQPNNHEALITLGWSHKELGNLDQALTSTLKSLELEPDNPTALMNLGGIYKELGNLDQALASTHKSLELKPDNPSAHSNMACIYQDLGNLDQARVSILKSLELKPDDQKNLMLLADIYKDLERSKDAKETVNQVLRATTKDSQIVTYILDFYDSTNEQDLFEEAIFDLKRTLPNNSFRLAMYEARALFRRKKYKESWAKLPTLNSSSNELSDNFSILRYHAFRGQIAEKNNHYDEAYYSFEMSQKNPKYKSINHKKVHLRIEKYIILSKKLAEDRARSNFSDQAQSDSNPVFLIGFPRSGTTLLDTVLRSHPDIEVVEEKDPLAHTETSAVRKLQRQISNFNSLKEEDLNILREIYRARIRFYSKGTNKLIIDKLPLHTISIPLINLLFPNSKIIFALRHPCDSILSCFQQTFKPNAAMASFTTLERSIDLYDKVMTGWIKYNENLSIDYTISKYEDLLDNFDESVLKVLKHLNLTWDNNVREYRNTAMNRVSINTPSSSQVVQPLYKSSVGRWKNYQKHFAKHMEKLNPWIDHFGYQA